MQKDGKIRFWKIMYEDELLSDEEFVFLMEYKKMNEQLQKEIK